MNLDLVDVFTKAILPCSVADRLNLDRLAILHLSQVLLFRPLKVNLVTFKTESLSLTDCLESSS